MKDNDTALATNKWLHPVLAIWPVSLIIVITYAMPVLLYWLINSLKLKLKLKDDLHDLTAV